MVPSVEILRTTKFSSSARYKLPALSKAMLLTNETSRAGSWAAIAGIAAGPSAGNRSDDPGRRHLPNSVVGRIDDVAIAAAVECNRTGKIE